MCGDKRAQHPHLAMITAKVIKNASQTLLTIQTHSVTRNMETRGWLLKDAGLPNTGMTAGYREGRRTRSKKKKE